MVSLGYKVRDKYSGFEGLVIGCAYYTDDASESLVKPITDDGNPRKPKWFKDGSLEKIEYFRNELKESESV